MGHNHFITVGREPRVPGEIQGVGCEVVPCILLLLDYQPARPTAGLRVRRGIHGVGKDKAPKHWNLPGARELGCPGAERPPRGEGPSLVPENS